jgi:hypothetical protein
MRTAQGKEWLVVKGRTGKVTGRIRRTSPSFSSSPRWIVEGYDHSFKGHLDAMKWLLKRNEGMQYQVKTALSHLYWTGKDWSLNRKEGKLYKTEGKAENVADTLREAKDGWDEVVVVSWTADNWGQP